MHSMRFYLAFRPPELLAFPHPIRYHVPSPCLPLRPILSAFSHLGLSFSPRLHPPLPPAHAAPALASFLPPSLAGPRPLSSTPPAASLPRLHPLLPLLFQCHVSEHNARFASQAVAREKFAFGRHESAISQVRTKLATDRLRPYGVQLPPQLFSRSFCSFRHFVARRENCFLLRLRTASTC
eukprot:2567191-Pleurochrysis_carterae.AAC.1